MDHQTGAAGQRPQKLTAKIERIGRWVEEKVSEVEEYRNTAGNRSQPATVCRPRPLAALARLQTDLSSDHRPCHNCPMAFNPSLPVSEKLSAAPFLGHPSCPQAAANLEPVLMGELRG